MFPLDAGRRAHGTGPQRKNLWTAPEAPCFQIIEGGVPLAFLLPKWASFGSTLLPCLPSAPLASFGKLGQHRFPELNLSSKLALSDCQTSHGLIFLLRREAR